MAARGPARVGACIDSQTGGAGSLRRVGIAVTGLARIAASSAAGLGCGPRTGASARVRQKGGGAGYTTQDVFIEVAQRNFLQLKPLLHGTPRCFSSQCHLNGHHTLL